MARRGTRGDQYFAIAAFYGAALIENLQDPKIPDFVLVHEARRAAHYALTALRIEEKQARKPARADALRGSRPARLVLAPCRSVSPGRTGETVIASSIPS